MDSKMSRSDKVLWVLIGILTATWAVLKGLNVMSPVLFCLTLTVLLSFWFRTKVSVNFIMKISSSVLVLFGVIYFALRLGFGYEVTFLEVADTMSTVIGYIWMATSAGVIVWEERQKEIMEGINEFRWRVFGPSKKETSQILDAGERKAGLLPVPGIESEK